MKKLCLHCCCAPCTSGVLWQLKDYDVSCYYYNPNISPQVEFEFRGQELKRFLKEFNIPLYIENYLPDEFENLINGLENEKEGGARCLKCFELRLRKTARFAKENGFDCFTTTLSVSPYKNYKIINEIGNAISKEEGIEFIEANFKKNNGFLTSIENSKKYNLYRQNYCGCKYSKRED